MSRWEILEGDALERLTGMAAESVQCCITSPPYWGLRDYGVDGQLGLEKTPEEYVEKMVSVFSEVRRVLRDAGTLWLNIGDVYAIGGRSGGGSFMEERRDAAWHGRSKVNGWRSAPPGLKHKDLIGIPWRVAFALQADGWTLRSDIIWHKPNPMPESVTDRPTKSHEYLFLLSKSTRYYYDAEAVREGARDWGQRDRSEWKARRSEHNTSKPHTGGENCDWAERGRNRRTVWTIPTEPFAGAHFAVMPSALVEPCILAGSAPGDLVLDPFSGSGTVGVVCRKHNRNFTGIELNPDYARMSKGRLGEMVSQNDGTTAEQREMF